MVQSWSHFALKPFVFGSSSARPWSRHHRVVWTPCCSPWRNPQHRCHRWAATPANPVIPCRRNRDNTPIVRWLSIGAYAGSTEYWFDKRGNEVSFSAMLNDPLQYLWTHIILTWIVCVQILAFWPHFNQLKLLPTSFYYWLKNTPLISVTWYLKSSVKKLYRKQRVWK